MLVIDRYRGAIRRMLAAQALIVLSFFIPAASGPTSSTQGQTPPPRNVTPLRLDELGPRTQPVDPAQFRHVRYVAATSAARSSATGERDDPWNSISEALARITDAGPENRTALLVAGGVYRVARLQLKPYVELYGGFEAKGWTRDITRNPAILDGGQAGPLVVGADHARLDGFTVRNGCSGEPGGAVSCRNTSPWISNNIFTANRTRGAEAAGTRTAASLGVPGGAIACLGGAARPLIEKNVFAANTTGDGDGGAIACMQGAEATIRFNIFAGNIAGLTPRPPDNTSCGGAIACESGAAAEILGNLIVNNLAGEKSDGGGLFIGNTGPLRLLRNVIAGNQATGSGGGLMTDAPPDFIYAANVIAGNSAAGSGGGVFFAPGSRGVLESCLVCENKAASGGGITADGATLRLDGCTVCMNQGATGGGFLGLNTRRLPQSLLLLNSIFGFNQSESDILMEDQVTTATIATCDAGEAWEGDGNISQDPRLAADGITGQVATMDFNPQTFQTRLVLLTRQTVRALSLPGRLIQVGAKHSVIAGCRLTPEADRQEVTVWGDMLGGGINRPPVAFTIPPTYRLLPDSPCIGAGSEVGPREDLYGYSRLAPGRDRLAIDIGAVEYQAPAPRINPLIPALPPVER